MRRLLQPKNIMVSAHARTKEYDKSKYISILNIIQVSTAMHYITGVAFRDPLWMSDMHAVSPLSFQPLFNGVESWDQYPHFVRHASEVHAMELLLHLPACPKE